MEEEKFDELLDEINAYCEFSNAMSGIEAVMEKASDGLSNKDYVKFREYFKNKLLEEL